MKRSDGERIRVKHTIVTVRSTLDAIEIALADRGNPMSSDGAQAIATMAILLAMQISRVDAYMRAEEDT